MRSVILALTLSTTACVGTLEPIDPGAGGGDDTVDPTSVARQIFEEDVSPLLRAACASCHVGTAGTAPLKFLGATGETGYYTAINGQPTVIGGYDHPKVRLPGSGGSQEIAAWANRCYIMTPHQKRRFPEKVEFMTSAGFIGSKGDREKAGLRGGGMLAVVTDIGILEPDETGEMTLTALHPGKTIGQAKENTGWELKVAADLKTTELVSENELRILREELDPTGIYLKGGG